MKKTSLYILLGLLALCGCKKNKVDPSDPMTYNVTVSREQAYRAWVDLYPSDEFVDYHIAAMPVEDYARQFGSDEAYLLYRKVNYDPNDIQQGAYISICKCDYANKAYYLLIVPFSDNEPTGLRKVEFTTQPWVQSHFQLKVSDLSIDSLGTITVTPKDSVSHYFWDFDLKKMVNDRFYGMQSLWFYRNIIYYYSMDFFPDIETTGMSNYNLFSYFSPDELHTGDTLCLSAVGYQNTTGETSDHYYNFLLIYNEKIEDSYFIESPTDHYEYVFRPISDWPNSGEVTSPKRSTAKEQEWSRSWLPKSSSVRTSRYIPQHIPSAKH